MKLENRIRKLLESTIFPLIEFVIETAFLVISFLIAIEWKTLDRLHIFLIALAGFVLFIKVVIFIYWFVTRPNYLKSLMGERLSSAMLKIQQQANSYKSRHILQTTYSSVLEWHPFNHRSNVLVYDVHEQIRTILLEFKNAIVDITPELEPDAVTVDLVYCYCGECNNGSSPMYIDDSLSQDGTNNEKWKMIGSTDSSFMNCSIQGLLKDNNSFYSYLRKNNYVFLNDKFCVCSDNQQHYTPTGKDYEYGLRGSIVGLTLSIKNDAPQGILVKAMLTVTTYGVRLYEKGIDVKEEDYKELFRKYIMNGCKSMLESELSQMYIRHVIREKR